MLAALAAILLGVGAVSTPQFVADEAQYAQVHKTPVVVQVADTWNAGARHGEGLGL